MTNAIETGCCCGSGQVSAMSREMPSSALEILAERFARGEIEKAELEEKRQIIETPFTADSRKECCC